MLGGLPQTEAALRRRRRQRRRAAILEMRSAGELPKVVTFNSFIQEMAEAIWEQIKSAGACDSLVDACTKHDDTKEAEEIFVSVVWPAPLFPNEFLATIRTAICFGKPVFCL